MTTRPQRVPPGGAVVEPGVYRMPEGVRVIVERDGSVTVSGATAALVGDFAVSVGCSDRVWFLPHRAGPGQPFTVALDATGAHQAQCRAERLGTHEPLPVHTPAGADANDEGDRISERIRRSDLRRWSPRNP